MCIACNITACFYQAYKSWGEPQEESCMPWGGANVSSPLVAKQPRPCPSFSGGKTSLPFPHLAQSLSQQAILPLQRRILRLRTNGILFLVSVFPFVFIYFFFNVFTPFNCFSSSCQHSWNQDGAC